MTPLPISAAAAALFRALLARAKVTRDRILLSSVRTVDWQSLTLIGERHEIELHIPAPAAESVFNRLVGGLEDAEFSIPGQIVADICARARVEQGGGSIDVVVEALTIAD